MKNKEAVEKTLNSLEGLKPASAGDNFYHKLNIRLAARMEQKINWRQDWRWQSIAAAIILLLVTNLTILLNYNQGQDNDASASEILANEYDLLPQNSYEVLTNYDNN